MFACNRARRASHASVFCSLRGLLVVASSSAACRTSPPEPSTGSEAPRPALRGRRPGCGRRQRRLPARRQQGEPGRSARRQVDARGRDQGHPGERRAPRDARHEPGQDRLQALRRQGADHRRELRRPRDGQAHLEEPERAMGQHAGLRRHDLPSHHQGLHDPGRRRGGQRLGRARLHDPRRDLAGRQARPRRASSAWPTAGPTPTARSSSSPSRPART